MCSPLAKDLGEMIYQKLMLGFVRSVPVFVALMQQPVRPGDHPGAWAGERARTVQDGERRGLVTSIRDAVKGKMWAGSMSKGVKLGQMIFGSRIKRCFNIEGNLE